MRAVSVSGGVDIDRIVRAAVAEIGTHSESFGGLSDAVLVMSVKLCRDEPKENGTEPPRETRSR